MIIFDWTNHWLNENPPDRKDFTGDPRLQFDYVLRFLPKPPFTMLEIGCGMGVWATLWKDLGATYEGLDANPDGIALARTRHPDLVFYQMPAQTMEFVGRYSLVFTHTCLQHTNLESKKRILPGIKTALKAKGILTIQEATGNGLTETTFDGYKGWIEFIEPFGFKCVAHTPDDDNRNGMVFVKI